MMKKKIFALLSVITLSAYLTSCNYQMIDFNYSFEKAYVKVGNEWIDLEIKTWNDYEGEQIQITLKDGTVMIVSSVNCILYNGKLPKDLEDFKK